MSGDAREALAAIATRLHVRTRRVLLYERGQDVFEVRCRFKVDSDRVDLFANQAYFLVMLEVGSAVAFSTPSADPQQGIQVLLGQVAGEDVYIHVEGRASPTGWIYRPAAVEALGSLEIGDGELVSVRPGGVTAILRSRGADADWNRLQRLLAVVRELPAGQPMEPLDPARVPVELRDLIPLLVRWGVADDLGRSEVVSQAVTAELRGLVDHVRPRLRQIAEFLDHADAEAAEEAAALDALAQSVMEAEKELRHRTEVDAGP